MSSRYRVCGLMVDEINDIQISIDFEPQRMKTHFKNAFKVVIGAGTTIRDRPGTAV